MSSWRVIRLIAEREVRVKLASRSFLLSTAGMIAAVVLGGVLVNLFATSDPLKVGLDPGTAPLAGAVSTLAGEGDEVRTEDVADAEAGKELLTDGKLDALLVGTPDDFEVYVDVDLDPSLQSVFTAIAQQQALGGEIESLGGDPEQVAETLLDAAPVVTALDPQEQDGGEVAGGYLVGILIFLGLIMTGQLVAQGVVEEKTSRVVELLLATVRPWQLMAGKVLGIGLVGLAQIGSIVAAMVGTATMLDLLDTSSLDLGTTALSALGWFVIGYVTYALALAGLAALVSRQEEVASVTSPVTMLMTVPYIVGVSIATWEPENPLVVWMSQLPFTSPLVMPIRMATGEVPGWQVAVSVALSLALIPVLVWLTGRIYSNAVLHTGGRMKLVQALRPNQPENQS